MFNKLKQQQVGSFNDLLQIKEHQVVSRALIKGEETLVTMFALDGEEISEERYVKDCMYYVLEGTTTIMMEDCSYTLTSGEYLIVQEGILHALVENHQLKMLQILS